MVDNQNENTAYFTHGFHPYPAKYTPQLVNKYLNLFCKRGFVILDPFCGRGHRHNDYIEIIWDDGVCMPGLLFGNQTIDGTLYPKQVSSYPYFVMGKYFRRRLGVPDGAPVRRHHLNGYNRIDVNVSLIGEGVYYFDFSKPK